MGEEAPFVFTKENFRDPKLPHGLEICHVRLEPATDAALSGLGRLFRDPATMTVASGTFEIVKWPVAGWRQLDPGTGDEAGTTEGTFEVEWQGDYYVGRNNAVATENNVYLDGLGAPPERASRNPPGDSASAAAAPRGGGDAIYLWMSDYHPDGGQLFWPLCDGVPYVVCLGPGERGDDIRPEDMRAFLVPPSTGLYIHPGTWHNGVYVHQRHSPASFLTRQGRVHARVSASWAAEFNLLLRIDLSALARPVSPPPPAAERS